jgi:hypothetical protein
MLVTRGIWHNGWKAVAEHGPVPLNRGKFDQDRWQLFHTDEDRAEAHDLAEQHPDKLEELKTLWLEEAKKYDVLPLNDLGIIEFRSLEYTVAVPESGQYTYYPGTAEVPQASAANTLNVSYRILAEVEFTEDSQGVIVAQGSRFGGYSLFVKDGKLTYVYNFLGIPPEQKIVADAPTSGIHVIGVDFTKERAGEYHEPHGPMKLLRRRPGRRGEKCGRSCRATASAVKASASGTTVEMPSRASTHPSSRSPAAKSSRSCSTSPTTPTSTSSGTSPPRSPAISPDK